MLKFGTDGIRANVDEFTPEALAAIIDGLLEYYKKVINPPAGTPRVTPRPPARFRPLKIFLAGDTRESTAAILEELAACLDQRQILHVDAGVLATPAICRSFAAQNCTFAIDVTASHNSYTDNGIKIFTVSDPLETTYSHATDLAFKGSKLSKEGQKIIEKHLAALKKPQKSALKTLRVSEDPSKALKVPENPPKTEQKPNKTTPSDKTSRKPDSSSCRLHPNNNFPKEYFTLTRINALFPAGNDPKIAFDLANGADAPLAKYLLKAFPSCEIINADPSYGRKINHNCGSTHPEQLQKTVVDRHCDLGIAFDGDGDRCIFVDHTGQVVDGDQTLAIFAELLQPKCIVTTIMSDPALANFCKKRNIELKITDVGDQNVVAAMQKHKAILGGEPSGHIIFEGQTMSDGLFTATMMIRFIKALGTSLFKLSRILPLTPRCETKISITKLQKTALKNPAIRQLFSSLSQAYQDEYDIKLVIRPSGTEPVVRIAGWHKDPKVCQAIVKEVKTRLSSIIKEVCN